MRAILSQIDNNVASWIAADRTLTLQIDITNACNLKCSHCYHLDHINDGAMSFEQWQAVLIQYESLLKKIKFRPHIVICGGEPMGSPLLAPILNYITSLDSACEISILTNGTLVNRFNFDWIKSFKKVDFQVSLDGPNEASHDSVRGKGSFYRTARGIREIRSKGYDVNLLAVLSKRTSTQITDFFGIAKSLGASSMNFTRLIVKGAAEELVRNEEDRPLNAEELRDAMTNILFESAKSKLPTSPQKPLYRLLHPRLGRNGRFGEGLVVDYRGNLLASSRSRLIIGHVFREGLESTLLTHPILKSIRRGEVATCGKCEFYERCGGDRNAAFAYSGDYLGADPGCWRSIRTI